MNKLSSQRRVKINFNSPVILCFSGICLASLILSFVTGGITDTLFFSVYHSSPSSPLTWLRMIGHCFGHAGIEHFMGNITLILIIGPLLEEKYGIKNMILVIFATALASGLIIYIFFPNTAVMGASGVVFALILLSSFTQVKEGEIPLTFILVAVIYIGEQIYQGIFIDDNVSNITHIAGGIVGALIGYMLNFRKMHPKL